MEKIKKILSAGFVGSSVVLLAACGGGGSGTDSVSTGSLTLGITDAPIDSADSVTVVFDSVTLQGPERTTIEFDEPMVIDLLDFQNGERVLLLDEQELLAGDYQFIRLGIVEEGSFIEVEGQQFPLEVPSGSQSGLQLNRGFTLAAGGVSDFTVDFDLRRSITITGNGDYMLRPTLRIVDALQAVNLTGVIDESFIIDPACNNGDNNDMGNVVYLFSTQDVVPQDVQGNDGDPIASANVEFNSATGEYEYTIGFVAVGNYTLAFTCDALLDNPEEDNLDVVNFPFVENIAVGSN